MRPRAHGRLTVRARWALRCHCRPLSGHRGRGRGVQGSDAASAPGSARFKCLGASAMGTGTEQRRRPRGAPGGRWLTSQSSAVGGGPCPVRPLRTALAVCTAPLPGSRATQLPVLPLQAHLCPQRSRANRAQTVSPFYAPVNSQALTSTSPPGGYCGERAGCRD